MEFLLPLVVSVLAICLTTCKLGFSIYRLIGGKTNRWIETSICFLLFIFSVLLSVFSAKRDKTAVAVVLSLNNGALITYQVSFLTFFYVSFY